MLPVKCRVWVFAGSVGGLAYSYNFAEKKNGLAWVKWLPLTSHGTDRWTDKWQYDIIPPHAKLIAHEMPKSLILARNTSVYSMFEHHN